MSEHRILGFNRGAARAAAVGAMSAPGLSPDQTAEIERGFATFKPFLVMA
jgi:hypothetical protein